METARTLLVLIALLVAGFMAVGSGKKLFLTLGQYAIAAGLLAASFANSYPVLIASLMLIGIGAGFVEALVSPLVADAHPEDSGKYLNIAHAFYPAGVVTSALLFGELLTAGCSWRTMFRIAAAVALAMGFFVNGLRFPSAGGAERSAAKLFAGILGLSGFWLFAAAIFLGAGVESALTFWSRSYVETYLTDVPRGGAIAVVVFAGTLTVGRLVAARLSRTLSLKTIMMGSAVLGVAVSCLLPFAPNLAAFYALLALAGFAAACFWPTILAEASNCLRVDSTALFVMLSCFGIAGFGLTPLAMGAIGDMAELRAGFFVVPGLFVVLIVVLALDRRK